jgi:hypothetical protein
MCILRCFVLLVVVICLTTRESNELKTSVNSLNRLKCKECFVETKRIQSRASLFRWYHALLYCH